MIDRLSNQRSWSLLILAAALLIAFHRLLLGEVFFWGLPALQFYPWREYAFDLIRQGQLPLWNPYNGAGAPLLANYQSALLYPLNWFGLVLPLAWAMSVTAVLHLFIAGWGMWRLTHRLGFSVLGQGISALAFAFTGYTVARLGTYPTVFTAAWIPWALWAALGLLQHTRRRDVATLALVIAMQLLAGHAQTTWYSMLLLATFSAWWLVTHRPFQWRALPLLILALVLGAAIAAAQLIPTAELLAQSQRSDGVDYETVMNFSYAPARLLNFLSPNIFGNPGDGSYITKGAFFEDAVYIGLIPLVAALVAVITWLWRKLRRVAPVSGDTIVPFALLITVVGLLLAFGKNAPFFPFLYDNIPTFSMFQAPVRWHIWTVFGLSLLAGVGVTFWSRGYWLFFATRLAIAGCLGAAILALIAPEILPPEVTENAGLLVIIHAVVVTGLLGAAAGVLTLIQPESTTSSSYPRWILAVLLVVALDLIYAAQGLNPTIPASFFDRQPAASTAARGYWPTEVDRIVKYDTFLLFDDYRVAVDQQTAFRSSHLTNLNLLDRIPIFNNFEPLLVGLHKQYADLLEDNPAARGQLLQAAAVSQIYTAAAQSQSTTLPAHRAWFVSAACYHPDLQSLQAALIGTWEPAVQVHLLGQGDCQPPSTPAGSATVQITADTAADLRLTVSAPQAGWLVLADTHYPGWQASLDGTPLIIQSANLAFRAVPVPAGEHQIAFTYQPAWLLPALLISFVAFVIVLVMFRTIHPDSPITPQ